MKKKRSNFLRDLKAGNKAEQCVADLFTSAGFPSSIDKEARIAHDVISEYKQTHFTTEVKFDAYEARSGNVAIEVFNTRSCTPSGITATRAFFWAHVLQGNVVWLTTVDILKDYIDRVSPKRIIDSGGDDNASLYLYSSAAILPSAFTRIDTMKPDKLRAFIHEHMEQNND